MDNDKISSPSTDEEQSESKKIEQQALDDDIIGGGFKQKTTSKKGLFKITRRQQVVGGGVAGIAAGSILGFSVFLAGPLQFIHFGQILQKFHFSNNEEFMDGRTGRFIRNWRKTGSFSAAQRNVRLTRIGNKMADRIELKLQDKTGLRTVYNADGNAIGLEIVDRNKAVDFLSSEDLDLGNKADFDTRQPADVPDSWTSHDGSKPKGAVISFKNEDFGKRRKFLKGLVKGSSTSKIAGVVSARVLARRAGVNWHPLNKLKKLDENINDFLRNLRKKNADDAEKGTTPPEDVDIDKNKDTNGDGEVDGRTADGETGRNTSNQAQADAKANRGNSSKTKANIKTSILSPKGAITSVSGFIGILCTVRAISDQVDKIQYANIVLPMMRIGFRIVSTGNQVMSGNDVSVDELSALSKDFTKVYGEGENKKTLSWSSAKSIQAELGETDPKGPDIPPTAKPKRINEESPIEKIVNGIFDGIKGSSSLCTTVGSWVLTIGELAINFSGVGGLVWQAIKTAGGYIASAAGVNPMDILMDYVVNKLAGEEVDMYAQGPDLGNIANYGVRLAANDQALAMGGTKLTGPEVAELDTISRSSALDDFKKKSFFARTFDLKESNSVVSKALLENTAFASLGNFSQSTINSTFSSIPNVLKNIGSIFIPKTVAATNYDYGFDEYGFSWEDQNNTLVQDPFANADKVENEYGLDSLNKDYSECFSTRIEPNGDSDLKIVTGQAVNYLTLPEKCNNKDERFLRYRFYIADTLAAKSLACYEGVDENSCGELGFGSSGSSVASANSAPITGLTSHPSLGGPTQNGYYLLPDAPNGEYQWNGGTPPESRYGSKALVDMIYTVAVRWYQKYPQNKLIIGDLNARAGHASHKKGIDVDITTVGGVAANTSGDPEKSKELGHMFADTGIIDKIFYNDGDVEKDFNDYVARNNLKGHMEYWDNHENHFHVRILSDYILQEGGQP